MYSYTPKTPVFMIIAFSAISFLQAPQSNPAQVSTGKCYANHLVQVVALE